MTFIDRADIKAYIGPPSVQSQYEMLAASVSELQRAGIVKDGEVGGGLCPAALDLETPCQGNIQFVSWLQFVL